MTTPFNRCLPLIQYTTVRFTPLWITMVALVTLLSVTMQSAQAGSREDMLHFFDTVIFGSEIAPSMRQTVVAKWPKGRIITFAYHGQPQTKHLRWTVRHITQIANLTKRPFRHITGPERAQADFHIFYLPGHAMDKIKLPGVPQQLLSHLSRSNGCYFVTKKNQYRDIASAYIVVNIDRSDESINACILEEITQAMGLPNDTDMMRGSVFNDRERLTRLGMRDIQLIKLLYDDRMVAGMSRTAALKRAQELLNE
uniref:DUF2927 domain-containing protein n=1 Tax=Magnetococcus massalia (strain MO-1) TaxID=451514 RepID=A0A1S7LLZ5_MAGMO|nr:conserved exported protein of unknown function [Candidatus Magnetococcus massalia]